MGTAPVTTVQPSGLAEVRDAVADVPGRLAVAGAGTAAGWAGPLDGVDAVVDLSAHRGVLIHNPGDMTVSVAAGTPLRDLQDELAAHGQHVALDAARVADGATVGGLLATADAGPAALVHGGLRDLVIGVTAVLADGTVARSGGHVIKNVAGYDLAKLLHGAHGTLAVVAEVVLRLHPLPAASTTLALDCPLDEAAAHAARVLGGPYEPAALEWVGGGPGTLLVRLDGTRDALPARVERVADVLGAGTAVVATSSGGHAGELRPQGTGPASGGGSGAADPWARHAAAVRGTPEHAVLRLGVRPSRLPAVLAALPAATVAAGLGTGVATVGLPPDADAVAEAHRVAHAAGGTSVLRARPDGLVAPAWGPPPSAVDVLRAVKRALDPDGRLGPGRLAPWY